MNRLLLAFVLATLMLDAFACSGSRPNTIETFERADRVFRAKIIATELKLEEFEGESREVVHATYDLLESYKGENPQNGLLKELPFAPGNCMLGLLTGVEYVVFLKDSLYVTMPSGSWAYINAEGSDVAPELEKLRAFADDM
ncbi:hypothetical protein [Wenzhouxiangella sp. EGI_FJ10409]|uniref:hypothetical protein n=1 Tax=Wenzhouxiangella sp. EGI_FJ10409 TaxID=3243767 RepID=UPI0035DFF220